MGARGGFEDGAIHWAKASCEVLASALGRRRQQARSLNNCLRHPIQTSQQPSTQVRKLSLREVKRIASGHTAAEWERSLGKETGVSNWYQVPKLLPSTMVLSRKTEHLFGFSCRSLVRVLFPGASGPPWVGERNSTAGSCPKC